MAQQQHYNALISSLDQFIRKFYLNKLIRGSLLWMGSIALVFLLFSILENSFFFGQGMRKFLFYSFIAGAATGFAAWVAAPLMKWLELGKRISHEQAAAIIGSHFSDVQDKLLNILQLRKQAEHAVSPDLALASIEQKTQAIRLVPFKNAIDLSRNRKHLRYVLPPLLILLALLVGAPSIIKDSTYRIIKNNQDFERDAPFAFHVKQADDLSVVQYDDFLLHVEVEGAALPNEVFINVDDYQYRLKKASANTFTYRFKNVHKETDFKLFSGPVASKTYTLDVLKKPNLLSFDVRLDYPGYTGRRDESLSDIGDLVVPAGTRITWELNTLNTDNVQMRFGNEGKDAIERRGNDLFSTKRAALDDMRYTLFMSSEEIPDADSIEYTVNVIPDLYPKISVEQIKDSLDPELVYFVGSVGDDYGVTNLEFNYQVSNEETSQSEPQKFPLSLKHKTQFQYDYTFDIAALELKPGDDLTYYFEVFDNDGVNGSKSTKTTVMQFSKPTIDEYEKMEEENSDNIKETLLNSLKESQKLQEEMRKMREKLLQEKDMEWQNKKELENLMKRQQELQNDLQNAQDLFQENMQNQDEFKSLSEEMQEKQDKLNEFFEELMNEEMEQMLEELSEKMEELEKKDALKMLEDFELSEEELQKELDRLMELFKQMEIEQQIQEQLEKLEELAQKQEELAEKTQAEEEKTEDQEGDDAEEKSEETEENNKGEQEKKGEEETKGEQEEQQGEEQSTEEQKEQDAQESGEQEQEETGSKNEELQKEQEEIQEEFKEIADEMEQIQEKNKELEKPKDMDGTDEQMERIDQDMENSQQQLQKQQNQKAAKSQKSAAQRMKEMAQQMSSQMQQGQMQQMEADLGTLRQLLENLVTLSFDQEDIISDLNKTNTTTPRYVGLVQDQFKIQDDFKVVEDTLQALSKRVMQIESFITEKVTDVKSNLQESLTELEERKKATAADYQQRTMTNLNDLALMLSEVMNQMQQQMSMMMPGNQMCDNPGAKPGSQSGKVPMDKITEGQQQLNEDMKKMMEGMKKGRQEGEKGSSEQFARMAARQAAMRKALRDAQQEKQQRGQGDESLDNAIKGMDEIETELVNKRLTNEMLKRQEEILTRLLEAERAEREREMDNKRKAETAQQIERKLPPSIEEYIKKREAEVESFQTVSPDLRPYYKFLVEEYYDALKKQ